MTHVYVYSLHSIDLNDRNVYRDLSKPIGALDAARLANLRARFESAPSDDERFLYGTHYRFFFVFV
jgi:hypothetical protein